MLCLEHTLKHTLVDGSTAVNHSAITDAQSFTHHSGEVQAVHSEQEPHCPSFILQMNALFLLNEDRKWLKAKQLTLKEEVQPVPSQASSFLQEHLWNANNLLESTQEGRKLKMSLLKL